MTSNSYIVFFYSIGALFATVYGVSIQPDTLRAIYVGKFGLMEENRNIFVGEKYFEIENEISELGAIFILTINWIFFKNIICIVFSLRCSISLNTYYSLRMHVLPHVHNAYAVNTCFKHFLSDFSQMHSVLKIWNKSDHLIIGRSTTPSPLSLHILRNLLKCINQR